MIPIEPMLAHRFDKYSSKIKYPAYSSPKLDGERCIAEVKNSKITLWTRSGEIIKSCPHIEAALLLTLSKLKIRDLIIDGELYIHGLPFNKLMSLVRPNRQVSDKVEYHIFDLVLPKPYSQRLEYMNVLKKIGLPDSIKIVDSELVSEEQVQTKLDEYIQQGYEGLIIRNSASKYVQKRSFDLQKYKKFIDSEFEIVGVEEAEVLKGHGIFICKAESGKLFTVKKEGRLEDLKEVWSNRDSYTGKLLTVKYQELSAEGVPRFPIGKSIR